ncbi:Lrp/AsnC family transcriptional regulator [Candidatus Marinamargulisbacteria bacterium SCGC AG-343-D04]|nr:Lrp/AsnC family transcriptional regulator [Candidatus Marinamargulisbacteria bacterium SCGC AG-343-D04]
MKDKKKSIKPVDLKILKLLQDQGRITNLKISQEIGLTPSATMERVRKLEERGFINQYVTLINPENFDFNLTAFVWISTTVPNWDESISEALLNIAYIQEIHEVQGQSSYLCKIKTKDVKELSRLLRDYFGKIGTVSNTQTQIVMRTIKETPTIDLSQV